jgi:hypothetical protein
MYETYLKLSQLSALVPQPLPTERFRPSQLPQFKKQGIGEEYDHTPQISAERADKLQTD